MERKQILKTSGVALLLVFAVACNRSPEARRNAFVANGKALMQKHDYSRAILELRNAVRVAPDDAEVYYQLGLAYFGAQDVRSGLVALKKATDLNPKHAQAQLKLAQILSLSDNKELWEDAKSRLTTLLQGSDGDKDTLNALAFTELKLGSPVNASQTLERVLAQSPGELASSVLLAQAKLTQNDAGGAVAVLQKACQNSPKSAAAQRYLAELYILLRRIPEAEVTLRRSLELAPKDEQALMDLARVELTMGRKAEAEGIFKQLAAYPAHHDVYALFLFGEGRRDEGLREFERVAKSNSDDRRARAQLVAAYTSVGRVADAKQVLDQALKSNSRDAEVLIQRAEIFLRERKLDDAELNVNRALKVAPEAAEVHYIFAKTHQARGRDRIYRQELAKAVELNPALLPIRLELAQALLAANQGQAALDLLAAATESQKNSTPVLVQRNWALWAMGDQAALRKGIDQGLERERAPELLIQDGLWRLRTNDPKGARASLEEALKTNPADLRALEALRQTYLAEKNAPEALHMVKDYAARQPKSAPVQDFLGVLLMAGGDTRQARKAFDAAKNADPKLVSAQLSLVQLDVSEGQLDDARNRLQSLLSSDSGNATAQRWLGNLDAMKGEQSAAIQHFRNVLAADSNDAQAANNLAYLLAETGQNLDEALKYAQHAIELVPDQPDYADTLGWILYKKGVYTSAVPYLEKAGSHQNNAIWKYHLAMAYAKAGDLKNGRITFAAALKLNPNAREAQAAREVVGTSH